MWIGSFDGSAVAGFASATTQPIRLPGEVAAPTAGASRLAAEVAAPAGGPDYDAGG
jgi:hypothetical protein